jgi:hypothetical protein
LTQQPGLRVRISHGDADSIVAARLGDDLRERAGAAVVADPTAAADTLIVLIGPDWLRSKDEHADVAAALATGTPALPVLVRGAALPRTGELPPQLAPLADRPWVELSDETWEEAVKGLAEQLEHLPARGAPVRPAMLPPADPRFVGRQRERAQLVSLLGAPADPARAEPRVTALVGPTGAGKAALAVEAGQVLRDRYSDGQLYARLGDGRARDVLGRFLRELGVPRVEIPRTGEQRVRLYASVTKGRRLLVVLCDVGSAEQVRPLLPRGGASGVLLTAAGSRLPLDLEALADAIVPLGPLSEAESQELLEGLLLIGRAEPGAMRAAAATLGHLPILLRTLASRALDNPEADLRTLADEQARQSDVAANLAVAFELGYEHMPLEDQRLFRRLALLFDPEFEVGLAAALADASPQEAQVVLERLVARQLVELSGGGRYRVRDTARPLSEQRLEREEPELDRAAAAGRMNHWLAVHGEHHPEPRIARDYWTTEDKLGYGPYAQAITEFIRHRQTEPPLTIGIKAPWGAGKTSVMRMVQERLDPPADPKTWRPRPLRLQKDSRDKLCLAASDGAEARRRGPGARLWRLLLGWNPGASGRDPARRVTVLELLGLIRERPAEQAPDLETLNVDPPRAPRLVEAKDWRPTVWFNPWMYQSGEQIWAGLAYEIISQVTDRLEPGDRERFWLELNLRRIDRQAVRRKVYRVLVERLLPVALGFGVAALVTVALLAGWVAPGARHLLRDVATVVASLGTAGLGVGVVVQLTRFLLQQAAGPFAQLVREPNLVEGSRKLLADEAAGAWGELVRDPGYEERLGFLYLVQTDMKRVLDLVVGTERPLVVFVDDLDRCSPGAVAQVIEAINLFLAGQFPNCIFVLAMEPAMVAAHVEVAYKELVETLKKDGPPRQWSTLGWRFLEKIVQLPLSLPLSDPHDDKRVASYVDSLLVSAAGGEGDGEGGAEEPAAQQPAATGDHLPEPARAPVQATPPAPSAAQADTTPAQAAKEAADSAQAALVRDVEAAIRKRKPTIKLLPALARAAQDEVLGRHEAALLQETIEAYNRVFAELYSDADAYEAILDAVRWLESGNPREIKRFVNLYRFYTFIAEQQRLQEAPSPSSREVAKLAVLAIRWPHLLNLLGSGPVGDSVTVLAHLERHASAADWPDRLREAGLVRADGKLPEDLTWAEDLRRFLTDEPPIAEAGGRLL